MVGACTRRLARMTAPSPADLGDARRQLRHAAAAAYTVNGRPTLRESTVVFMDLLGATTMLNSLTDGQLVHLLGSLRANIDLFDSFPAYEGPARVVTFSDNIAAALPLDDAEQDGGITWQVLAAGSFQLNLAFNGLLARGGITVGPAYADDSAILGAALVRAYHLESKVASYPRVVLDPECIELFALGALAESDLHTSVQNQIALVDTLDGLVFVHYLAFVSEADDEEEATECLRRHESLLQSGLREYADDKHVLPKYVWAADYHDWTCQALGRLEHLVGHREVSRGRFMPLIDYLLEGPEERQLHLKSAPWGPP